jgi:hypothetical protein
MLAGTSYPFWTSHASSASPCDERTVTDSYGPTTLCDTTWTVGVLDADSSGAGLEAALEADPPHPPPPPPSS